MPPELNEDTMCGALSPQVDGKGRPAIRATVSRGAGKPLPRGAPPQPGELARRERKLGPFHRGPSTARRGRKGTVGGQSFAESSPDDRARKGFTRSSGRGKMMVEFFSVAISVRVCR